MAPTRILALAALLTAPLTAQIDRDLDLPGVRLALEQGAERLPELERAWEQGLTPGGSAERSFAELFGYAPPGHALNLAVLHAYLYRAQGDEADARSAAAYLARMADYRERVPAGLMRARVEYAGGLPAVPSFFHLADYAESWSRVKNSRAIDGSTRRRVEEAIASSADFVFVFPEWGPHNRAMLRAESLIHCALALPDHPRAADWRKLAAILAADSSRQWEIEDAQIYHPIWLLAVLRYAEAAGDERIFDSLQVRYYLRYFLELLSPLGTVPDFGDGWWGSSLGRTYQCLQWGATALDDPELQWAANRVYRAMGPLDPEHPGVGRALLRARLAGHLDPALEPREPVPRSGPVLDDLVGKKTVLRTGWGEDDLYLLLNFRDEGDWGVLFRDYLRQTLAVVEEKMHHGHADENSIVLMMDGGSVLLHDAGYRDVAPSGPFGAYRADIFHNRVVARPGRPAAGQDLGEFLRDAGAYRSVRTERVDFLRFEDAVYSRTRVESREGGWVWDRTLILLDSPRLVVVVDSLRITRAGEHTFAGLWAAQEVLDTGPGWARCANRSIGGRELGAGRELLLCLPTAPDVVPGSFPLIRHSQPEQVLYQVRSGRYEAGRVVSMVSVLWPVEPGTEGNPLAARVRRIPCLPRGAGVALEIDDGEQLLTLCLKTDLQLGLGPEDVRPRYDPERGRLYAGSLASDAD
ncbi:MAG: hypothetical protein V3T22_07630, partial [Planctomycetota bacterium]